MKFSIPKKGMNILSAARKIGYIPQKSSDWDEVAFIRPIERDYPRFHLYVKEDKENFIFNLHLDQKKPSYGGQTAHSGEYDGEKVISEVERIKNILIIGKGEYPKETKQEKEKSANTLSALFRKMLGS